MSYYYGRCYKTIKLKSKTSHLKSLTHKEYAKCKHINLTIKNPAIKEIDNTISETINEYNKNYDYYLINYDFNLDFNNYESCPHRMCDSPDYNIIFSRQNFFEEFIDDYKDKRYTFKRIDEIIKWLIHMISKLNILCVLWKGN